jgi:hypothetical protein
MTFGNTTSNLQLFETLPKEKNDESQKAQHDNRYQTHIARLGCNRGSDRRGNGSSVESARQFNLRMDSLQGR